MRGDVARKSASGGYLPANSGGGGPLEPPADGLPAACAVGGADGRYGQVGVVDCEEGVKSGVHGSTDHPAIFQFPGSLADGFCVVLQRQLDSGDRKRNAVHSGAIGVPPK
jgi:hypothetical protein